MDDNKTPLQFIKTAYGEGIENVSVGALYFLTDTNMLAVGVSASDPSTDGLQYFSGVRDADFDSSTKVLTIVRPNGEEIELDFSDVASAEGVTSLLGTLRKDLNLDASILGAKDAEHAAGIYNFIPGDGGDGASYIKGTNTVRQSLVLLDRGIQDAMENAGVTTFGGKKGAISVAVSGSVTEDGSIVFTMDTSCLTGTVYGIKDSAFAGMLDPSTDVSVATTDGSIASVGQIKDYVNFLDTSLYDALVGDPSTDSSVKDTIWGSKNYTKVVEDHLVEVEHVTAAALTDLDERLKSAIAGGVNDVKVNGTSVKDASTTANLYADGIYNASTNQLATVSTVTTKIDAIEGAGLFVDASGKVTATTQAEGDNSTNIATTAYVERAVATEDASIAKWFSTADISAGTFDSSLTKVIQVKKYVTDYINSLDSTATIATMTDNIITLKAGLTETDGIIANSTESDITLAKVAKTGIAADVAYADASDIYTATNVEDALTEVMLLAQTAAKGMRYRGGIDSSVIGGSLLPVQTGDMFTCTSTFIIGDKNVETGDIVIYNGADSSTSVTLTAANCVIVERETDSMVTKSADMTSGNLVFSTGTTQVANTIGDGGSAITKTALETAMANANSAVQAVTGETAITNSSFIEVKVSAARAQDSSTVVLSTTAAVTMQDVSTATSSSDGLATAYETKSYVDYAVHDVFTWSVFE